MVKRNTRVKLTLMSVLLCSSSGLVHASGFDNMGIGSLDLLFDPAKVAFEGGYTYINRNVNYKVNNARRKTDTTLSDGTFLPGQWTPVPDTGGPSTVAATPDVWNYTANIKVEVTENLHCLGRLNNPGSILEEAPEDWMGRFGFIKTELNSMGLDGTCTLKIPIRAGWYGHLIGGLRYIEADIYSSKLTPRNLAVADMKDSGWGWRIGTAFEIPEYAIRAQVFYDSAIDLEMQGTLTVGSNIFPVVSDVSMPQGVEFRLQSGIAPKWLAFLGVKWVDWSTLNELKVETPVSYTDAYIDATRTFNFTDGWTVTAGLGHQLTDKIQVGTSLTWDQGIGGSYSDTYSWGLGGSYDLTKNVKLSLGGVVAYKLGAKDIYNEGNSLTDLPDPLPDSEDYDDMDLSYDASWNFGVGTKLKISF